MHSHFNNNLLNLKGVKINKILKSDDFIKVFIVSKPTEHICPSCRQTTSRVHDYRNQTIKDLPFQFQHVYLILRKRRYVCTCGKKFYESYDFLPRYHRMTNRLVSYVCKQLGNVCSLSSIADQTNLSVPTVTRILNLIQFGKPDLPEVLSIDEFKGNAKTGKYQCIIVDGKKNKVLDILPSRQQHHLVTYFKSIPRHQRCKVKYFVCDMWRPYVDRARAFLPNAKIIIDKYHFIRQVTWAIEKVRKRLQKTMPYSLRKYFKCSRKLILTRYHKLKEDNKRAVDLMLQYNDDLRQAHRLKEWFYEICQSKQYSYQRKAFADWVLEASSCAIPEFKKCAMTYTRWSKEIKNAFKYGYTNGPIEGYNNKIKVLKRVSYGFKDFDRFRNRILLCTS